MEKTNLRFVGCRPAVGRARRHVAGHAAARFTLVILASLAFSCFTFAVGWLYQVREIKPGVFVWTPDDVLEMESDPDYNRATNSSFVITADGVVVVDTTNSPFHGREVLYEIRQRTTSPVRYVIDTDASPARTLGNEVFADLGSPILASDTAASEMKSYRDSFPVRLEMEPLLGERMRGFHPTAPTATFNHETDFSIGGVAIKIVDLGRGVSTDDAAVFLPQSKIVFLGGLFENGYIPHIGSGDVRHWMDILKEVEGWDAEIYVPAHGAPGGKQDVENFRQFLAWLTGAVGTRIRQGQSLAEIEKELLPFRNYQWHAPELESGALAAVYRELASAKPRTTAARAAGNP